MGYVRLLQFDEQTTKDLDDATGPQEGPEIVSDEDIDEVDKETLELFTGSFDLYNGIAGGLTYLVRFASCVTLHAVWASSVALLMHNNQDHLPGQADGDFGWDTILSFVVFYLGIAMVLHGLYDTLLKQELEVAALAVAAASFGWWSWLLYRQQGTE